jgi:hypothetical protein
MRVTHSTRRRDFVIYLTRLRAATLEQLQLLAKDKGRSSLFRTAALRTLICTAPLGVTGGRPYLEARRRVRAHYRV